MLRARIALAALLAAALAGAGLSACRPSESDASGASGDWRRELAGWGIATVPFEGGEPLQPVTGDTVLVLTDWQAAALAHGMPAGDDDATVFDGTPTELLDAIGADGAESARGDALTTSGVIAAWWAHADTPRAAAARGFQAPIAGVVPDVVLLLFTADALDDAGRTVDTSPPGAVPAVGGRAPAVAAPLPGPPTSAPLAAGTDGRVAAPDPCGTVGDAIGSVNAFLDDMGDLGTVIRGALEQAYGALDAVTGGALAAVKRAIAVANVVLNMGSLLTPWTVQWETAPSGALEVGLNGASPMAFTDTVRLVGAAASPPVAVQSCLSLLGILDPTSQKGTKLDWQFQVGVVPEVPDGVIVPGTPPTALGADNAAALDLTTGVESLTAEKRVVRAAPALVIVSMQRADAERVTSYIRSLGGGLVDAVLGGALDQVATAIELAVNPTFEVRQHVVRYWEADETPDPPAADPPGPAVPPAQPPLDTPIECSVSAQDVAAVSGREITSVRYGEFGDPTNGPLRACLYDVSGGGMIVVGEGIYPDDPAAVDPGFTGILTDGACNRASGYLELGPDVYGYLVWSGYALRGTYYYQLGMDDPGRVLATLARIAAFC
ncbi:MAG: hypothetical protein J0I43_05915 [Microbacterium sp.]|uniref:hypothetical protein n=1 Tax=Microbacterium sp. TaxID=51671 RepID=UPI001AC8C223|nr:hypothetical protein [Microbacterium sp.]MBN9176886.1 hypothetical protein [Microbacterium sp.]